MYNTTTKFGEAIRGDTRDFLAKIISNGKEAEDVIVNIQKYSKSTSGDSITIGGAISSYVTMDLWNPDFAVENAEVSVEIGLQLDDAVEWVKLGTFTCEKPTTSSDGLINVTAYDCISTKMGGVYRSDLEYPTDSINVLKELEKKTGVKIDTSNLEKGVLLNKVESMSESDIDEDGNEVTNVTYTNPLDGYTYREALGYIAMLHCKYAVADADGIVVFKWFNDVSDYTITGDEYFDDFEDSELEFLVGAISCNTLTQTFESGNGDVNIWLENPVMTQERLDYICSVLQTLNFVPCHFSFYGDIRLELFDTVKIEKADGIIYNVPIMDITQDFDGGLKTEIQSFGASTQEESGTGGNLLEKVDRFYYELLTVKEIVGKKANFDILYALNGEFFSLKADTGEFKNLVAEKFSAVNANIENLTAKSITTDNLYVKVAEFGYLTTKQAKIDYAKIDFSNVGTQVVNSSMIVDGAVTNEKVGNLSANKITSGTIDASKINVTNLNADNLIVGTINGQRIGDKSIDLNKLAKEVPTKEYLDSVQENLQGQIDGAIETFTKTEIPTLLNEPASLWTDNETKKKHVGDICYVVNPTSSADGYCYRFANLGTEISPSYEWVLIKDSDVTKTLQDIIDIYEEITGIKKFDSEISAWKVNTDSELSSIKAKTTKLETDIGNKVEVSVFNTLKQTVDGNSSSITSLSTVVKSKADGSTVTAVSNRVTSVETSLSGFRSEVSSTYTTKQEFNNLTIGGRNLYVGASKWRKDTPATTGTSDDAYLYLSGASTYLEKGKTYTLQAVCDLPWSTAHGSGAGAGKGTIWIASEDRKYHKVFTGDGTTSGRYTWTFVHDGTTGNYNVRVNGYTKATKFWDIKIESGNKATDWTPAPEDIASDIKSLSTAITQTDGKITTNAKSISDLGTRVSTVEQTASSLSVSLQSTDKNVSTVQTTANSAKTAAANAQTTADNAAKTATNFLSYDSSGLQIGNKSSGTWSGYRTQITSSAFNILGESGQTIASYGANKVELGKNSTESEILLCGGLGTMKYGTINLIPYNAYGRFMQLIGGNVALNGDRASLTSQGASSGSYSIVEVTANKVLLESADYATAGDGTPVWAGTKIELLSESREINIVGNTDVTGALSVNGTQVSLADHAHNNYLPLSGGTLTGNLTGKYITGTWLQSTAASNMTSAATKYAVLDGSGWIYYRTAAQVLSDVGAASTGHTHNSLYNSALDETITFLKDGNYGYFRPNTASLVYCGSSARPWYKVYTERLEVTKNRPTMQPVYDNTVSYETNCYISSAGLLSRTTKTSSRTIKHDIKAIADSDIAPERLYDVEIYQFKYNEGVLTDRSDSRFDNLLPGFIIEELAERYPIAVDRPSDNVKEWSWNAQYLIPPMLKLIQNQHEVDEQMEQKIAEQKAQIEQLTYQVQQLMRQMEA